MSNLGLCPQRGPKVSNADRTGIIRAILFKDWDPFGFGPLLPVDEYDAYPPGIVQLLENHCTAEQMEAHLVKIEKERFGAVQASGKGARSCEESRGKLACEPLRQRDYRPGQRLASSASRCKRSGVAKPSA
jgi:hypothetical protein